MKDELKYIDNFYKNNLGGYKEEAGKNIWKDMRWTLFWMRYKWMVGISSVLLLGLISFIYLGIYNSPESTTAIIDNKKTELVINTNYKTEEIQNSGDMVSSDIPDETSISRSESKIPDISIISPDPLSTKIINEKIEIDNSDENYKSTTILNYNLSLTEISSKEYGNKIASFPDSNSIGYNRRTDILLPGLKKHWFSINIAVGPAFSQSDISGYDSEYLAFRNSNESNKPGVSLGVDLRLHIKNWIISTGLAYSVYNQSRSYKYNYEEYSPEDSYYDYDTTWAWFFDPPDIGIPIMTGVDSTWVDVYNSMVIDNSGTNQMKYFEIPIMVGYTINSNLFAFEINAGVSGGFLVYSDVKVPDFNNPDDIVTVEQMNSTILNFVANASFYYHISRRTSLFVSPYYKQNLNSVFSVDYPVNQKLKTYGLNFGINMRF